MDRADAVLEAINISMIAGRRGNSPRLHHYASDVGTPCWRQLWYSIVKWRERGLMELEGLYRVGEGEIQEEATKERLAAAGYRWLENQRYFLNEELRLSGRIEGYMAHKRDLRDRILGEIKSVTPYFWPKANEMDGFLSHGFYRRYPFQVHVYMREMGVRECMLFFKNRDSGRIRPVVWSWRPEIWEEIEEKCRKINEAVDAGVVPDRVNQVGEKGVCQYCGFRNVCLPDVKYGATGISLEEDPALLGDLRMREEVKEPARQFQILDDRVRERVRGHDGVVVGEYLIEGRKHGKGWRARITRIGVEIRERESAGAAAEIVEAMEAEIGRHVARYSEELDPEDSEKVLRAIDAVSRTMRGGLRCVGVRLDMVRKLSKEPAVLVARAAHLYLEGGHDKPAKPFRYLWKIVRTSATSWYIEVKNLKDAAMYDLKGGAG